LLRDLPGDRLADLGERPSAESRRELAAHEVEIGLLERLEDLEDAVVDDPGAVDEDRDDPPRVEADELQPVDDDAAHLGRQDDADVLADAGELAGRLREELGDLAAPVL